MYDMTPSMGGMICQEVAACAPDSVDSLGLLVSSPGVLEAPLPQCPQLASYVAVLGFFLDTTERGRANVAVQVLYTPSFVDANTDALLEIELACIRAANQSTAGRRPIHSRRWPSCVRSAAPPCPHHQRAHIGARCPPRPGDPREPQRSPWPDSGRPPDNDNHLSDSGHHLHVMARDDVVRAVSQLLHRVASLRE
ncbi:Aste57867_15304 [Aphanomyces stellatus]|uniref:Aste57867_15304 protein n=1 Tax=Aphanomyces stellatus TaxID=120398 RepID=A0A485L3F4_9STRA|nr:hypothetical protein As57867_015248 [Aphanomyces stellatus]VFT92113.1 Aste57867_15304 [Aphanomyces stellatus]